MPCLDGITGIHGAAGIKTVSAELRSQVNRCADLVRIEAGGGIIDLDRHAGGAEVFYALHRTIEISAHPHAIESFARGPVEAHLHRLHTERFKPLAIFALEVVPVRLDLQLAVAPADVRRHIEEARMDHRLATRE